MMSAIEIVRVIAEPGASVGGDIWEDTRQLLDFHGVDKMCTVYVCQYDGAIYGVFFTKEKAIEAGCQEKGCEPDELEDGLHIEERWHIEEWDVE